METDNPSCIRSNTDRGESKRVMPNVNRKGPKHEAPLNGMMKPSSLKSNDNKDRSSSAHFKRNRVKSKRVEL